MSQHSLKGRKKALSDLEQHVCAFKVMLMKINL